MNTDLENKGTIQENLLQIMLMITVFSSVFILLKQFFVQSGTRRWHAALARYGPFFRKCFLPYMYPTHGM